MLHVRAGGRRPSRSSADRPRSQRLRRSRQSSRPRDGRRESSRCFESTKTCASATASFGQQLGESNARRAGGDRRERAAIFDGSLWLGVEEIEVARPAAEPDQQDRTWPLGLRLHSGRRSADAANAKGAAAPAQRNARRLTPWQVWDRKLPTSNIPMGRLRDGSSGWVSNALLSYPAVGIRQREKSGRRAHRLLR